MKKFLADFRGFPWTVKLAILGSIIVLVIQIIGVIAPPKADTKPRTVTFQRPIKVFVVANDMVITEEGDFRVGVSPDGWICYRTDGKPSCHYSVPLPTLPEN